MAGLANLAEFLPDFESWLRRLTRSTGLGISHPLPEKIVPVGHRGTKIYAPENTILAHEKAYELGARCMEFDVRCSSDGHFVVIHDHDVDRTTDGRGDVENLTLAEIKALDAGRHKGPEFAGARVPTLREALENVQGRFAVDIDFKGGPDHSAPMIAEILRDEGFDKEGAPLVTIFARVNHFEILEPLAPEFALRPHYLSRRHCRKMVRRHDVEVMGLRRYAFSKIAASNIRGHGMHLFSNAMGRDESYSDYEEAANAGALFIQTDYMDRLVTYLDSIGRLETGVLGRNFEVLPQASSLVC